MFIDKLNVVLSFQNLKNVDILYDILFRKLVFLFQKFMTIYPPFWYAYLYVHFWKVLPLLKKVERGTYAYALNVSKGCKEFVLKWLINKIIHIFGDMKYILIFLLLCPL